MRQKLLRFAFLTLLAYLLQATVANHIALFGVAPNLALALIAIVTVGMGRKYTFVMSAFVGYLLEIMLTMLDYMNMLLYPICATLGALIFSDKSERKLEEERSAGKAGYNLPAHLRTVLCAAFSVAVFEAVNVVYIYLSGVSINGRHIARALIDILYSAAIAGALQFPIRWWLGVYRLRKAR